ncbi:GNAT family N-acetyltransferase [Balneatrix alpica]|uniref:GNAT family N-acetyltransferase n=1 Tax=Balneatrix alpica TaxID=75684 RepID=UPI002739CBEC|nr:GNAT family N-acetyltransferase [Balneatrix alpica]
MSLLCSTDRLIVRQFNLDDSDFILRLLNDESFIRYIADKKVRNQEDAQHYLRNGPLASYSRYGFGLCLVQSKAGGIPMGMCGILKRDELEWPDLGYAFLPAFWRQGYAYEAAQAVLQHSRQHYQLERVLAVTLPDNASSNGLLQKLGFVLQGQQELYGAMNNLYQYDGCKER